ncbi:MAG: hypothetical protein M3O34_16080 [Chloroflexota bacterium]|nr:hypothetical protein [Chloroflexota bacterium]
MAVFALLLVAFAGSTSLPLSIGLMGLIGVDQAIYLAINNALVQLATPDALQGRVMSIYIMTWGLYRSGRCPKESWPTGSARRPSWSGPDCLAPSSSSSWPFAPPRSAISEVARTKRGILGHFPTAQPAGN